MWIDRHHLEDNISWDALFSPIFATPVSIILLATYVSDKLLCQPAPPPLINLYENSHQK
jgi:hypothetical protein